MVIGYGNPLQGDRAVGSRLVDCVDAWNLPHVHTRSLLALTPELAAVLSTADAVIFVNACWMSATAACRIRSLEAHGSELTGCSVPGQGHGCDPESLLALTLSAYGRCPQAWWIEIAADDMRPSDRLSDIAAQGMQEALNAISNWV